MALHGARAQKTLRVAFYEETEQTFQLQIFRNSYKRLHEVLWACPGVERLSSLVVAGRGEPLQLI